MLLGYVRRPHYQYTTHTVTRSLPGRAQILVKVGDTIAIEQALIGLRTPRQAPEPRRDLSALAWFLAGAGLAGVVALTALLI